MVICILISPKALGGMELGGSSSAMAQLVAEEIEKWVKVVRFAGIKPI
jgi:hypothetical protein